MYLHKVIVTILSPNSRLGTDFIRYKCESGSYFSYAF